MKRFIIVLVSLMVLSIGLCGQTKADYIKAIETVLADENCQVFFQAKVNGKPTILIIENKNLVALNISSKDFKSADKNILIWGKADFFMHGMKMSDGTVLQLNGNGTSITMKISAPIKQQENKRLTFDFQLSKDGDRWILYRKS